MIAGLVLRQEACRMARVTSRLVEIDHPVVCAAGANPLVHRLTLGFADLREVGSTFERRQRRTENPEPSRVRPFDELLVCGDQILGGGRGIVPRRAGMV